MLFRSFVPGSIVRWESTGLTTAFVSSFQLTAFVPGVLFQGTIYVVEYSIVVVNPGGTSSNVAKLRVQEPFAVTGLVPSSATAGGPAFILTVNGSGFEPGFVVQWNRAALPTSYLSRRQLQAAVAASLIVAPGMAEITVRAPGGFVGGRTFLINAPGAPRLTALIPPSVNAGDPQFTLAIRGEQFQPNSVAQWNGTPLATTFLSETDLRAAVPAALVAATGTAVVTVTTPAAAPSNELRFSITCGYALTGEGPPAPGGATSALFPPAGGAGSVRISTAAGCGWTASSNAPWVTLLSGASGAGSGRVTYAVAANDGPERTAALTIAGQSFLLVQLALLPAIAGPGGVLNAASLLPGLASGAWISVFGRDLASTTRVWSSSDFAGDLLPARLDGVGVNINGRPAYVYFISPGQLNVLAPEDAAEGAVPVEVVTPRGRSTVVTVQKRRLAPAFFPFSPAEARYVAAVFPDGTLVGRQELFPGVAARPARPGETVLLFATGLGPTTPPYPEGQIVRLPAPLRDPLQVRIGGLDATVDFAGIVGAGLYQINARIPDLPDGDSLVSAQIQGFSSQDRVYLAIQR